MRQGNKLIAFTILVTLITSIQLCLLAQPKNVSYIDSIVPTILKTSGIPGMAIVIVRNDSVLLSKGYGIRSIDSKTPVTNQTIFGVGSLTKAMTATALAMLVDSSIVSWDDRVKKHLPEFRLADPYVTENLEIQDVLSLREGIPRGDTIAARNMSAQQIISRMAFLSPTMFRKSFGEAPNIMYLLAGQIVSAASGSTWDEFVKRRIFVPLQMNSTSTKLSETKTLRDLATPHIKRNEKVQTTEWRGFEHLASAGAVNSNVDDLANWLRFNLSKGRFCGQILVSEKALSETYRAHSILSPNYQSAFNQEAPFNAYGFGWVVSQYRNRTLLEHGGSVDGFGAVIAIIPEEQLGIVILSNLNFLAAIPHLRDLKFSILNQWLRK